MSDSKKVLFVGEHPYTFSGNGNMMMAILQQVDFYKNDVCCFLAGDINIDIINPFKQFPVPVIPAYHQITNDVWGVRKLLNLLYRNDFDKVIFIGIDMYAYASIANRIKELAEQKDFEWICITPYDLPYIKDDYINLFKLPTKTFVYSEYAYDILKNEVPGLEYFRPPLYNAKNYTVPTQETKNELRKKMFQDEVKPHQTLFTYVGTNQRRKNIPRMIKAFDMLRNIGRLDFALYMHTPIYKGDFNIEELLKNYPELKKHVYLKNTQNKISPDTMNYIYQISDIHVNVSHQEGLSWTPIEAMLCGVPCILSESTAHFDYLHDDCTFAVEQDEMDFIMQYTESGPALLECGACSPSAIKRQLVQAYDTHQKDPNAYAHMTYAADLRACVWVNEVHDINKILTTTYSKNKEIGFVI